MVGGVGDLGPFKALKSCRYFRLGSGRPFLGDGALRGNRNCALPARKTGEGDRVETSLIARRIRQWHALQGNRFDLGQILDDKGYQSPFSSIYRTDDRLIACLDNPRQRVSQNSAGARSSEWLSDPRFETMKGLMSARAELRQSFAEAGR